MNVDFGMGIYGFLDPNGAGKPTLLCMLSTVEKPEAGGIFYQGEDIFQMGERYQEKLEYVPQKAGYYPDFTAYRFLQYFSSQRLTVSKTSLITLSSSTMSFNFAMY